MIRRYFIRCPLEAALAAKNHGFKFDNFDYTEEKSEDLSLGTTRYNSIRFCQIIRWYNKPKRRRLPLYRNLMTDPINKEFDDPIDVKEEYQEATIYIHPDSLPLLEIRVGDLIELRRDTMFRHGIVRALEIDKGVYVNMNEGYWLRQDCAVIQRNGKPFPTIEHEDVE